MKTITIAVMAQVVIEFTYEERRKPFKIKRLSAHELFNISTRACKQESRDNTAKINADFEAMQLHLRKYVRADDQQIEDDFDRFNHILSYARPNRIICKSDVDFLNSFWLPSGYQYSPTGDLISINQGEPD